MDAHHSASFPERPAAVSISQVIALGLVAASIGWAAWLLRERPIREETELLSGNLLPSSELAIMEAAFDRAQLTDYRTEGGRVYVPRSRQSAYMRALVDAEALPREFGGSLRRALAGNSPWQSKTMQAELLRVATQEELSLVLCSMPGIERAAVLYDVDKPSSLTGGAVKTASVSIRTQPDVDLDPARVQAIRILVAASIAGLSAERVAVTDLRSGRVFAGPLEEIADEASINPALARKLSYERLLGAKLRQSISYVKGAVVDVTVEFGSRETPPIPAAVAAAETTTPQKVADANAPLEIPRPEAAAGVPPPTAAPQPAPPRTPEESLAAVRVSIAIPEHYLQSALATRARVEAVPDRAAFESAEVDRIRGLVAGMIPATTDPQGRQVTVSVYPTMGSQTALPTAPPTTPEPAPSTEPQSPQLKASADSMSLSQIVAGIVTGQPRIDPKKLPREFWLAGMSVCVGLLAGLLWWAGARRPSTPVASGHAYPQIDWSGIDERGRDESPPRRAAA